MRYNILLLLFLSMPIFCMEAKKKPEPESKKKTLLELLYKDNVLVPAKITEHGQKIKSEIFKGGFGAAAQISEKVAKYIKGQIQKSEREENEIKEIFLA